MRKSIDEVDATDPLAATTVPPDQGAVDRDGDAAALRAHVAAFTQALAHQNRDFVRLAADRIEAGKRIAEELVNCDSWDDLHRLQAAWAEAKSEACLLEARWLLLYADLIRHPAWLTRQVEAGKRTHLRLVDPWRADLDFAPSKGDVDDQEP